MCQTRMPSTQRAGRAWPLAGRARRIAVADGQSSGSERGVRKAEQGKQAPVNSSVVRFSERIAPKWGA